MHNPERPMTRHAIGPMRALLCAAAILSALPCARAQTAPGAGDVIRTLPPPPALAPAASTPPAPPVRTPAPPPQVNGLQGFELKEVRFAPTEAIGPAELRAVAAPYLNRRVEAADLAAFAKALQQLYVDRGFGLVAIALPSQNLTQGTLNVVIVEPRFGRVTLVQGSEPPINEARARGLMAYAGVQAGRPLNLKQLDRAMFSLNDLPGTGAKATLAPSGDEGVFDLVVETEGRRVWDMTLDFDNHGSRSTGIDRLGALMRWNNPLHIGDNLDLRLLASERAGLTLGRLAYEAPLGDTPWRAMIGLSRVEYELGGSFSALQANGVATVRDAGVSYPLIRSRGRNLIVRLGVEDKVLEDRFDALALRTGKRIRNLVASAAFEDRDELWGGGFNGASLQAQVGRLRIDTDNVRAEDAVLGAQATQGDFGKLNLQVSRLQAISQRVLLYAGLTGQWASKNLDGAEKLTLGGARAVRAYPTAEAPSDEGVVFSTELRCFVNPSWTVFGLYDWAKGRLRKRPDDGADNTRVLDGAGIGLYFNDPRLFTLKATLAWRGRERPQSESGNDSPRLYVQLQRPF